jgi:hypothetical protein
VPLPYDPIGFAPASLEGAAGGDRMLQRLKAMLRHFGVALGFVLAVLVVMFEMLVAVVIFA